MIIVRCRGGLGNQIFQYVFGQFLMKYVTKQVFMDISEYDVFKCHDGLEADKIFNFNIEKAKYNDIIRLANYVPIPWGGKMGFFLWSKLNNIEKLIVKSGKKKISHVYENETREFTLKEYKNRFENTDSYFDGYWCSNYYIDQIGIDSITFRQEFIKKYRKYLNMIHTEHACSVHVRLGDYVGSSMDVCKKAYYQKAINIIKEIDSKALFYIFSDDILSARTIVDADNKIFFMDTSEEKTAGLDLYLMSQCRYNIIANSTYSFWASKINHNPDKIVIMPQEYHKMKFDRCKLV